MNKKPKVSIGLEIEINNTDGIFVDYKHWELIPEHCGWELRSVACKSPTEIKGLIKSIKKMGTGHAARFDNTGTHIHIDFLNDSPWSKKDLTRLQVPKNEDGTWANPLNNGMRYVWVAQDNSLWPAPKAYLKNRAPALSPIVCFTQGGKWLEPVKRFMLLGKRFAHVLFALQHPTRRFNKYCHSIGSWDEAALMGATSVSHISSHPRLLQNHRRHMFNTLSFSKFDTIEVRMIRGSLDYKEIWEQVYLFGKMAQCAKGDAEIPKSTGDVYKDFYLLMGACGIHGKMRRRLVVCLAKMKAFPVTEWTARCFNCEVVKYIKDFYDYGLSRPICRHCHDKYDRCAWCGFTAYRSDYNLFIVDKKIPGGRGICGMCVDIGIKTTIKTIEADGTLCIMGIKIGSGTDDKGPVTLRRMRELFK